MISVSNFVGDTLYSEGRCRFSAYQRRDARNCSMKHQIIMRAMDFLMQITMVPAKAESLLALADRLEVRPVAEVVEKYLVSQINYENAIDALLL